MERYRQLPLLVPGCNATGNTVIMGQAVYHSPAPPGKMKRSLILGPTPGRTTYYVPRRVIFVIIATHFSVAEIISPTSGKLTAEMLSHVQQPSRVFVSRGSYGTLWWGQGCVNQALMMHREDGERGSLHYLSENTASEAVLRRSPFINYYRKITYVPQGDTINNRYYAASP